MQFTLEIHRCTREDKRRYVQSFLYSSDNSSETIATALTNLNSTPLTDISGNAAAPIVWQCSCLQKKCGACAMVINGRPGLACARKLSECGNVVRIEPLHKFPVVEDLMVDRSIMQENLKMMKLWFDGSAALTEKNTEIEIVRTDVIKTELSADEAKKLDEAEVGAKLEKIGEIEASAIKTVAGGPEDIKKKMPFLKSEGVKNTFNIANLKLGLRLCIFVAAVVLVLAGVNYFTSPVIA